MATSPCGLERVLGILYVEGTSAATLYCMEQTDLEVRYDPIMSSILCLVVPKVYICRRKQWRIRLEHYGVKKGQEVEHIRPVRFLRVNMIVATTRELASLKYSC